MEARGPDWVQVRIGGSVSLQIFVPTSAIGDLGNVGEEVHLHTRLYIRDDEAVLYGFPTPEALRLFQMLNGVSGIGPRTSLSLLSSLGPQTLITAVATEDVGTISKVPGVGRKSAGRLVLELKGQAGKGADRVTGNVCRQKRQWRRVISPHGPGLLRRRGPAGGGLPGQHG